MEKSPHPSDSRVNLDIEKVVIERLREILELDLKTEYIEIETDTGKLKSDFKLDFYFIGENKNIIGEVYARLGKNNSGSIRKVMTDCLKLVYAENFFKKHTPKKACEKMMIFVDKDVADYFDKGENWKARAIKEFGIIVKTVDEIGTENIKNLDEARKLHQLGNQKK